MSLALVAIGDSKTIGIGCCVASNGYRDRLVHNLISATDLANIEFSGVKAVSGITTDTMAAQIDAFLATQTVTPEWVLVNIGSNDADAAGSGALTAAAWKADLAYILDAIHTKWASASVRVMRVMYVGEETGTTLIDDFWIPDVLSTRSAWAAVGPDERTFLPGHLTDVTHPDAYGYDLTAAEWQTAMSY